MFRRMTDWSRRNMPTRESFEEVRWLRPIAHLILRPELWRFTRRSVPRGIALGLFVGIFLLLPGVQIIGVAILSLPFRANIPIGALMTFVSIPPTTLFVFLPGAIWISNWLFGLRADIRTFFELHRSDASIGEWANWIFSDVAVGLIAGLFIIAAISAVLGYAVAALSWRFWIAHKWRTRHDD